MTVQTPVTVPHFIAPAASGCVKSLSLAAPWALELSVSMGELTLRLLFIAALIAPDCQTLGLFPVSRSAVSQQITSSRMSQEGLSVG